MLRVKYFFMKLKLLVVDDDECKRVLLSEISVLCGLEVVCVEDGLSALNETSRREYDIVLLDYFLHGTTGDEVKQKIDSTVAAFQRPYYVLASSDVETCYRYKELGFDDVFFPPYDVEMLSKIVTKLRKEKV